LDLPVSSDQATACFRIFQEALTNVARHAHATHVRVRVQRRDGQAIISVGDNGRGLDEAALAKTGHLGLVGMRERAASVSASLEINGEPGKGTRVILHVPLSEAEAR
jgi:signal transduction histidine kinase